MPPIPQFAKALAQRAKAKPKVIKDLSRKIASKKAQIRNVNEGCRTKTDSLETLKTINILEMNPKTKLNNYGYKPNQKVKIYNENNKNEFVEITWSDNLTPNDIIELVRKNYDNQ